MALHSILLLLAVLKVFSRIHATDEDDVKQPSSFYSEYYQHDDDDDELYQIDDLRDEYRSSLTTTTPSLLSPAAAGQLQIQAKLHPSPLLAAAAAGYYDY